jgi:hypothetical protein
MPRLNIERQEQLQPKRVSDAVRIITSLGFNIHVHTKTEVRFIFKDEEVRFYPYSGWHTGKSIKDGRGLQNLLNQIK